MKTEIVIQNLKCGGCESTIQNQLAKIKGVHEISVDLENSSVNLEYDTDEVLVSVKETLAKIGYPDSNHKNTIGHKAKSYVSCAIGKLNE